MARFNALLGKNNIAFENIRMALDDGFYNDVVLEYDPAWQLLKQSSKWKKLLNNYSFEKEAEYTMLESITYRIPSLDVR